MNTLRNGQIEPATLADSIRLALAQFQYDAGDAYGKIETILEMPDIPAPVRNQLEAALGEQNAEFAKVHLQQALMLSTESLE